MIFVALGSNMGDSYALLDAAHAAMLARGMAVVAASTIVETPALLPPGAPDDWDRPFLNQVARVETALSPEEMLVALKAIEQELGRQDRGRWGPREIDLDLLAHGDHLRDGPELILPHVGMAQRHFVLAPLMEIAPEWVHPRTGKTVAKMFAELTA